MAGIINLASLATPKTISENSDTNLRNNVNEVNVENKQSNASSVMVITNSNEESGYDDPAEVLQNFNSENSRAKYLFQVCLLLFIN